MMGAKPFGGRVDFCTMELLDKQEGRDPTAPVPVESHRLISEAAYGPENLKLICAAFDRAWEAILPVVDGTPLAHQAARLKLANMLLSVASNDKLDQDRKQTP
jgi:hypothetical protein